MHKILIIAATALSLTACTTTEQGATIGAISGGVIGGAVSGNAVGAAVGAGIGAVTGAAAGELLCYYGSSRTECVYRRTDGTQFIAACPRR